MSKPKAKRKSKDEISRIRSEAGKRGYWSVINKYCNGNEEEYKQYLREICAWNYYSSTGVRMKYDCFGKPIWPERKPKHPSHNKIVPF